MCLLYLYSCIIVTKNIIATSTSAPSLSLTLPTATAAPHLHPFSGPDIANTIDMPVLPIHDSDSSKWG